MPSQQFKERLQESVGRLQDAYYSNQGDAFCHWAMRTYFELDDDEAFEACDVGGSNDRGLDAYWHDEDQRRIILAQAKYSPRRGKFGADAVVELERAYKWLVRLGDEDSKKARKELRAAAKELAKCRKEDPDYEVELYCFGSRGFTKEAEEQAKLVNEELWEDGVTITLVGIEKLEEAVREQRSRLDDRPVEVGLNLEKFFEFDPDDGPRTVVASIDVKELAEIEQRYHYRIFQRNVRYFLNAKNRVNKGIVTTLSSDQGRSRFWYYNNGIAAVCDSIKVPKRGSTGQAKITNLQIVNGCQTTTTLGEVAEELKADDDSPAYVLIRFIESDDLELQGEISRFNNRQSAVKDRDLMSNDDPQAGLERDFADLDPPWFYERKRGQWDAEAKQSPSKKKKFGDRRIDNEVAAQAAYAFWRDPAVARARKRMLFVRKVEDPTGLYEQIFTENTRPEWLLLPFRVQQFVARRKRAYMRELKSALESKRPSVRETKVMGKQWLKFADQILLGAIRLYWEDQMDVTRVTSQRRLLNEDSFEDAVQAAYDLALRDLNPFFRYKVSDGEKRGEPFDAANFLKSNWSEVRSWVEDQIDYYDNGDAFKDIPAFTE